jgi:tripartite-type tricarboxylate transporter receptor subunit TctC
MIFAARLSRKLGSLALIFALLVWANASWGQPYPSRPIRILIPQPPGGTMDTIARELSEYLLRAFAQNIVIDNRSGANGIIAAETLARAVPDGYTLLYTSASLANNQLVLKKPPFDTLRDFAPVTQVNRLPGYLVLVGAQVPAPTLQALIELSKNPKTPVHYGSSGVGNSQHLLGELLNARTGAQMRHVPYKGFAPILTAVMGNEIQVAFGAPTTTIAHIKAGRLRALAYTGAQRWNILPEVPTLAEAGAKGLVYEASWHGIFAPVHTPAAVLTRLQTEVHKAVQSAKMRANHEAGGHVPLGTTSKEFRQFLIGYFNDTAEQLRIAKIEAQ